MEIRQHTLTLMDQGKKITKEIRKYIETNENKKYQN